MSEELKPWSVGDDITTPCGHAEPQAATQLHGVCIFCWRDRCGMEAFARRAQVSVVDALRARVPAILAALEEKRAEAIERSKGQTSDEWTALEVGIATGFMRAIDIVKEMSK